MKIAYIYPALNTVGGADRIITQKANYFAEKSGYEVFIITAHQNGKPLFFPLSQKVKHIDLDVDFDKQYKYSFLKRGFIYFKLLRQYKKKLSSLLFSLHPDITLTTISRDIDFLYKIKDGSRKVAEAHVSKDYIRNLHLMDSRGFMYRIVKKIWTRKIEYAIKRFDSLVVLTGKDALNWLGIKQAEIIPDPLSFYPEKLSSGAGGKIISVGRLEEQKGYDRLISAWKMIYQKYPDWSVYVYGDGQMKKELTELIKEKGLEASFFIEDPVKNIEDKYIESSFYVMSSRFEGFGMVLVEAMSCGLPVISFDCPDGPKDIINEGEDGYLVENGNIKQLADKMSCLIEKDDIRRNMGEKARQNVKRYTMENIMPQWIELFETLIAKEK